MNHSTLARRLSGALSRPQFAGGTPPLMRPLSKGMNAPRVPGTLASAPRTNHKYVSRERGPGGWVYHYANKSYANAARAMKVVMSVHPKSAAPPANPTLATGGKDTEKLHSKNGVYTPERAAMHEKVMGHFLNQRNLDHSGPDGAKHPLLVEHADADARPQAVFFAGGAGSGKGFSKKQNFGHHPSFVDVDPDEIKAHLSEHDGLAGVENHHPMHWHEESSHISKELQKRAMKARKPFIFDGTGASAASMIKKMKDAHAAGYDVHVRRVHCPRRVAWTRNLKRARTVPADVFHDIHDGVSKAWPSLVEHIKSHGGTAQVYDSTPKDYRQTAADREDTARIRAETNKPIAKLSKSIRAMNHSAKPRRARVYLSPTHYLTGLVKGDTFHPHDEVHNGKSHVALTGKKAPYKPMKLSAIAHHKAELKYV